MICEECRCEIEPNKSCDNCLFINAILAHIGITKEELEQIEKEKEIDQ